MSDKTEIAWADSSFNPWIGCTKVGPGCDNCYAKADFDLRRHRAKWGAGNPRSRTSAANWKKPPQWNRKPFYECDACGHRSEGRRYIDTGPNMGFVEGGIECPSCGSRSMEPTRRRVFCASLADVFDNEVPVEWRNDLFNLIRDTPNLDWLLLTNRPQNILRMIAEAGCMAGNGMRYLPSNVWLGATCEDQRHADANIQALLLAKKGAGAAVAFLSMEPLLSGVYIKSHPPFCISNGITVPSSGKYFGGIDWVIVGGESGPKARPMHPDWARSLRDQCAAVGVPFLFKQWGEWMPVGKDPTSVQNAARRNGGTVTSFSYPDGETLVRVGKKSSGRLLDGVLHDEYPSTERNK